MSVGKTILILGGCAAVLFFGKVIYCAAVLDGVNLPGAEKIIRAHNKKTLYDGDYKKAVEYNDFEIAHTLLENLHSTYVLDLSHADDLIGGNAYKNSQQVYFAAQDYIYKKEISYILLNFPSDAADRIVFLLYEIPIDGECQVGLVDSNFILSGKLSSYISACKQFNNLCDNALSIAINQNNKQFSENVVALYKNDYRTISGSLFGVYVDNVKVDWLHGYVAVSTDSKHAAEQRVKKAFN